MQSEKDACFDMDLEKKTLLQGKTPGYHVRDQYRKMKVLLKLGRLAKLDEAEKAEDSLPPIFFIRAPIEMQREMIREMRIHI